MAGTRRHVLGEAALDGVGRALERGGKLTHVDLADERLHVAIREVHEVAEGEELSAQVGGQFGVVLFDLAHHFGLLGGGNGTQELDGGGAAVDAPCVGRHRGGELFGKSLPNLAQYFGRDRFEGGKSAHDLRTPFDWDVLENGQGARALQDAEHDGRRLRQLARKQHGQGFGIGVGQSSEVFAHGLLGFGLGIENALGHIQSHGARCGFAQKAVRAVGVGGEARHGVDEGIQGGWDDGRIAA